jgi:hypothetical protein
MLEHFKYVHLIQDLERVAYIYYMINHMIWKRLLHPG